MNASPFMIPAAQALCHIKALLEANRESILACSDLTEEQKKKLLSDIEKAYQRRRRIYAEEIAD